MNYYERHLGDYAKDAGHLSMLEHGAYTLLLDRYYVTEKGIPADEVYRYARARSKPECEAVDRVLKEFFKLLDGVWINGRCEEEIQAARARISTAQDNGKKGGRPPKKKPAGIVSENPDKTREKPSGFHLGSVPDNPKQTQSKALQSPDTNLHTPDTRGDRSPHSETAVARRAPEWGGVEPPEFVQIKLAYPETPYPNNWAMALVQCEQRTMEGFDWPSMLDVTQRFAAFAKATNHRVGRAENFFANASNLRHTWAPPKTKAEQQQDANLEASLQWLRESEARDAVG